QNRQDGKGRGSSCQRKRRSCAGAPGQDPGVNFPPRAFRRHARAPGISQAGEERTTLEMKPVLLRLTLLTITFLSLWLFVAHPSWFPAGVAVHAGMLDRQFKAAFFLLGILFLAGQLALIWVLGHNRREGAASRYWRGNSGLEFAWTIVIVAIFFWFNVS